MENRQNVRLSNEKLGLGLNLQSRNLNDWHVGLAVSPVSNRLTSTNLVTTNTALKRFHSLENTFLSAQTTTRLNLKNARLETTKLSTIYNNPLITSSSSLSVNKSLSSFANKKLKLSSLESLTSNQLLSTTNKLVVSNVKLHSSLIRSYERERSLIGCEPVSKKAKRTFDLNLGSATSCSSSVDEYEKPKYDFEWPDVIVTKESNVFKEYDGQKKEVDWRTKNKNAKVAFVNVVSSSLIRAPNLKDKNDDVRKSLISHADEIVAFDPEFVLKVALYARQELNIRSTCNLLLAYASYDHNCRPFLHKYFCSCIVLPSDWIEVAEQYQLFDDKSINFGSLPSSLRKVLVLKFPQFDVYQLAKYNKGKSNQKNKKRTKNEPRKSNVVTDDDEETEEERERKTFNLKQLIRRLHIKEPTEHVMGLIGKRYPEDADSFRLSCLPGTWDPKKAGQRMKLPVPLTWETQISAKGNKAETWHELIDKRKLPYMAMLRNLRNMILAEISDEHHAKVVKYLSNKTAVINSRQLPHRFLATSEVLTDIEDKLRKGDSAESNVSKSKSYLSPIERKKLSLDRKVRNVARSFNFQLLKRYHKAVNRAVEIAAFFNIPPISGTTLLLLDVSTHMDVDCSAAKGLGKPRSLFEIAELLAKMCSRVCEMCTVQRFFLFSTPDHRELKEDETMLSLGRLGNELLTMLIRDKKKIDNVIVFTNKEEVSVVRHFVSKYRLQVNDKLLYVTVGLAASNNKFIAERGNGGRIGYIDRIDTKYNLKQLPKPLLNQIAKRNVLLPETIDSCIIPKWRTVKVFISSTFLDMHGERDLLIRYIFPELRSRARSLFLDVHEVDLRWGITDEEANNDKALEICLSEITKCQLFVGILGERYGTVLESYDSYATNKEMDWLKSYPKGASITELEFHFAALASADRMKGRAFFFLRDNTFHQNIRGHLVENFSETNYENSEKLKKLKDRVRNSGLEVFDGYHCKWGGIIDGKPMTIDLEEFGQRVLNNLWNALQNIYANESESNNKFVVDQSALHVAFAKKAYETFIGRQRLIETFQKVLLNNESGKVVISGKQGIGKTSLMGHLAHLVQAKYPVIFCFIGASNIPANAMQTIAYLCDEIKKIASCDVDIPDENRGSVSELVTLLNNTVTVIEKLYIFLDGLDILEEKQQSKILEWLNMNLPSGVNIVCSVTENGILHRSLSRTSEVVLTVGPMEYYDRMELVRKMLSKHRKVLDERGFNNQLRVLVSKFDSGSPLYIHFACEELRSFGIFEKVTSHITRMGSTIEGLLKSSLDRLEIDFGVDLIEGALAFIVVCREGLYEEDLYELLCLKKKFAENKVVRLEEVKQVAIKSVATAIPRATFSRLMRSLYGLVLPADHPVDAPLRVAHSKVVQIIRVRYKKTTFTFSSEHKIHLLLAGYFWAIGDDSGDGSWSRCVPRALANIVSHLLAGGCYRDAENVLCNLNFVQSKAEAGLLCQLLDEYVSSLVLCALMDLRRMDETVDIEKMKQYRSFVSRNIDILKETPQLTIQQALNETSSCDAVSSQAKSLLLDLRKKTHVLPVEWMNKPHTDDRCQLSLRFTKPIFTVAMSPDGRHVCVGEDNVARLYCIDTGKEMRSFTGHTDSITQVLFVSNMRMVSSSRDTTISIWDVQDGHRVFVLAGHTRSVSACCYDPSGKTLVSVGSDSSIRLWSFTNGKQISSIEVDDKWSPYNCVTFHPQRQVIATGSWDGAIKIWDLVEMKRIAVQNKENIGSILETISVINHLRILHGHEASVSSLNVSHDGQYIVSCSLDCTLKFWSFKYGFQISTICTVFPFSNVSFSPSGSYILAVGATRNIHIYSSKLGDVLNTFDARGSVALSALILLPDGITVIAGFNSGCVQRINMATGKIEWSSQCGRVAVTCMHRLSDSDNSEGVIGLQDGLLQILNDCGIIMATLIGQTSAITAVASTKSTCVSGSEHGELAVYRLSNLKKSKTLAPLYIWSIHNGSITSIVFNVSKTAFATTSIDQTARIWSSNVLNPSGRGYVHGTPDSSLVIPNCHTDMITSCCWVVDSQKNNLLVTASCDLSMSAWNSLSGDKVWTEKGFDAPIMSLTSSDSVIITGAKNGTLEVWSADGIRICSIFGSEESAIGVLFKNQDKNHDWSDMIDEETEPMTKTQQLQLVTDSLQDILIARGTLNGVIEVLRPCIAKEKETLYGHSDAVLSLCSSVDGRIVTSSLDKTVKVWKPVILSKSATGETLQTHLGHPVEVTSLAQSKISSLVVTGDRNGSIIIWKEIDQKWNLVFEKVAAHDKAVTAVTFITNKTNHFATGSDDCKVKVWKFVETLSTKKVEHRSLFADDVKLEVEMSSSLELQSSYEMKFPVLNLVYSSKKGTLFLGTIKNFVCGLNLKSGKQWRTRFIDKDWQYKDVTPSIKSWILHTKVIEYANRSDLIVANSFGSIGVWNAFKDIFTEAPQQVISLYEVLSREADPKRHWPCSLEVKIHSETSLTYFIGLTSGEILICDTKQSQLVETHSIKIAGGAVKTLSFVDVVSCDNLSILCSGSEDGIIRIWKLSSSTTAKLKQVGQFHCKSPVTQLRVSAAKDSISVVCADLLGNVYFLNVNMN